MSVLPDREKWRLAMEEHGASDPYQVLDGLFHLLFQQHSLAAMAKSAGHDFASIALAIVEQGEPLAEATSLDADVARRTGRSGAEG